MNFRIFGSALALLLSAAMLMSPHAVAQDESSAMWPTTFSPGQNAEFCGRAFFVDTQGFCHANDARNGLEVGMKFQTARAIQITGVRIYRTDSGGVRGSLWGSDGTLLARGNFASRSSHGWQDMEFAQPVIIDPIQTYVVSYFTPGTRYAFQYGYYDQARTVGPITALKATDSSPNGVHCYDDSACGSFPTRPYKNSTYFVSPLWRELDGTVDPTLPSPSPTSAPTSSGSDNIGPRVANIPRASRIAGGASLTIAFSESVQATSITSKSLRLVRHGRTVRVTLVPHTARRVVVDPKGKLSGGNYRMLVSSSVRDLAGNRLDQDPSRGGQQPATWVVRVKR